MKYRSLENYAAVMTGIVAAFVGDLFTIAIGFEPFGTVCICSWFWCLIGVGAFLIINEHILRLRRKRETKTNKRRVKQVNFVVGKEIAGMPGYVEVKDGTAI